MASGPASGDSETIQGIADSFARLHAILATAVRAHSGRELSPVAIDLFPVYEDRAQVPHRFVTGNATYDRMTRTVTIFPPDGTTGSPVSPWSSPFVHAHELAHHVINLRKETFAPDVEEGFADLIAYLLTGADPSLIRPLPGFGIDRDPNSPIFSDGSLKSNVPVDADDHRKGAARASLILRELPPGDSHTSLRTVLAKFFALEI